MSNRFLNFFSDPEDNNPAFIRTVRNILVFAIVANISILVFISGILPNTKTNTVQIITMSTPFVLEVIAFIQVQRGKVVMAKYVVPAVLLIAITYLSVGASGMHGIAMLGYPTIIVISALLLGKKSRYTATPLTIIAILIVAAADMTGFNDSSYAINTGFDDALIAIALSLASSEILQLLISRLNENVRKAQNNENAQIQANKELKQLQESLEQQVEERTAELASRGFELEKAISQIQRRSAQFEALAQVAQSISSIRDPQELLPRITSVVSEFYGFYHVGIFLLDEPNEFAVLQAANSEGGKRMLERNHRLRVGEEGIVGKVTASGEARIALDVGKDAVYFGNPDLPGTHSEMALPLRSGGKVIGALDVQSTEVGAFSNDDIQTLSLLADQVSLAIENARLFENSSRTLNELQMIMRQSTREAWKRLPEKQKLLGFRYTSMGASPLKEPVELAETGKGAKKAKGTISTSFVVPIELRGEVIGNLVVQSPTGGAWNEDQQDLIRAVAERVALSAENARLFEETTQRAERERLVSEITGKIRSHNDPQAMIETAVNELRSALGASRVEIIPRKTEGSARKDSQV